MDKIKMANWSQLFRKQEQKQVFASERYTDVHVSFEEPGLASGFVNSLRTPGMQLTEFFLDAGRPISLVEDDARESAESVFVLSGASESQFQNISTRLKCNKYQHNFQYNQHFSGEHVIHSPQFHALTITYDLEFLKQLAENDSSDAVNKLGNSIHGKKPWLPTTNALAWQERITEIVNSMQENRFAGATRYLFLESKMMELFVLQMQQLQSINGTCKDQWSARDKEKLHAVREYIENTYLENFSLKDLTYKFNLNEFKLKKGYKQLFQSTVFGHVQELRMQKAKSLLREKSMNVSEAAYFIGYENVSSFCVEFKRRFGNSPGKEISFSKQ